MNNIAVVGDRFAPVTGPDPTVYFEPGIHPLDETGWDKVINGVKQVT